MNSDYDVSKVFASVVLTSDDEGSSSIDNLSFGENCAIAYRAYSFLDSIVLLSDIKQAGPFVEHTIYVAKLTSSMVLRSLNEKSIH